MNGMNKYIDIIYYQNFDININTVDSRDKIHKRKKKIKIKELLKNLIKKLSI